jgi:hypothetical protein
VAVDLEVERKKVQMGVEVEGSQQILLWIFASIGPGTAVGPTPRIKRANQISTVLLMQDHTFFILHKRINKSSCNSHADMVCIPEECFTIKTRSKTSLQFLRTEEGSGFLLEF